MLPFLFCYWSISSIQIATRRYQDANLYATPPIWSIRSEHGFRIARSLSSDPSMARAGSERSDPIRSILTDREHHGSLGSDRIRSFPTLLKTYNKLDTQREVGVPEAISHLLNIPDHYTEAKFERLHTSHLLQYVKQFCHTEDRDQSSDQEQDEMLDSQLVISNKTYVAVSYFDDYAYRGSHLKELCLYDYCSLVYKSKARGGISFISQHPQYKSHRQFIRQDTCIIPNLLGCLLFVSKDSKDIERQEEYYCLISWIFIPWSYESPHMMLHNGPWRVL